MPWVRIDDGFSQHPKVLAAGPLAAALQVAGLCYANRYLTDGFIPSAALPTLIDVHEFDMEPEDVAERLLTQGLWIRERGGYRIHDFLEYQPSRKQVLAEREAARRRMARRRSQVSSDELPENFERTSEEVVTKFHNPDPVPDPVPDPYSGEKDISSPPEEPTEETTATEAPEDAGPNSHSEVHRRIFDHWNSQGVVQHRKMTDKMRRAINGRLRDYSEDEILLAMDNYGRVIRDPDHFFFTYRWTLEDFLGRGFEKFRHWDTVRANFSIRPRSRDAPLTNTQRALEVARKFADEGEGES